MSFGYVYVLTNDSLPYVKIGQTTRSPEDRAKELSTTGVPTPFKVAYKVYVEHCEMAEQEVHRKLHSYRARNNREFFKVDLTTVVSAIEELCCPQSNEDDNNDVNFDPISYVYNLAASLKKEAEEQSYKRNAVLGKAKIYLHALFEYLSLVSGKCNSSGNAIYYLLDEDDKYIFIYQRVRLVGEPDGVYILSAPDCNHYYDPCDLVSYQKPEGPLSVEGDNKDKYFSNNLNQGVLSDLKIPPQQLAKHILSQESWATEEETQKCINSPIPLKNMLQEVWCEAADHVNHLLYFYSDTFDIETEYDLDSDCLYEYDVCDFNREELFKYYFESLGWLLHAESVAEKLHSEGMIPHIVSKSLASTASIGEDGINRIMEEDSTRKYLLSINHTIPDELQEVKLTIDRVGARGTYASINNGIRIRLNDCNYSEYIGKEVVLKTKDENIMLSPL